MSKLAKELRNLTENSKFEMEAGKKSKLFKRIIEEAEEAALRGYYELEIDDPPFNVVLALRDEGFKVNPYKMFWGGEYYE